MSVTGYNEIFSLNLNAIVVNQKKKEKKNYQANWNVWHGEMVSAKH